MILITEHMDASAVHWLQERTVCHYAPELFADEAALAHWLPYAVGWIVRNRTRVSRALLRQAAQLRVVGRLGAGLDNLDLGALAARSIEAVYAPGANANAVAELCLTYMLAHCRQLLAAHHSTQGGAWARQQFTGRELSGKTVGIVGLGAVGGRLAAICSALGCQVLVHTRRPVSAYQAVPLATLLRESDFISLNVPLTAATKGMIGAAELDLLKPQAFLINTARGEVVDEAALYQALISGKLAGAALDVRLQEPPSQPDPLASLQNVILTPHLAGWTSEAQTNVCQLVASDVWRVLQGEAACYPVPHEHWPSHQKSSSGSSSGGQE